jgi:hypothetical protein
VTDTTVFEYGKSVFIHLYAHGTHKEALAYVPDQDASSFVEAYRNSLHATRSAAEEQIEGDDEFVVEGVVNEDGSITYDTHFELTVDEIWDRAEVSKPSFATSTMTAGGI